MTRLRITSAVVAKEKMLELPKKEAEFLKTMAELRELIKPHLVCVCADAVEGRFLENRLTHECRVCNGVIPLKWAKTENICQP